MLNGKLIKIMSVLYYLHQNYHIELEIVIGEKCMPECVIQFIDPLLSL